MKINDKLVLHKNDELYIQMPIHFKFCHTAFLHLSTKSNMFKISHGVKLKRIEV